MNVLLTKDLKYRVSHNFISQSQDDGEETPPHAHKDPKWQAILPDLLTVKKSDLAHLEARKKKASAGEKDGDGTKDSSKEGAKTSNDNWLTKLSRKQKDLAKRKYEEEHGEGSNKSKTKKSKKSLLFKKGAYVYTRDRRIALKSEIPHIGGKRCYRMECRGTIVKESTYYDGVWVVKFDDGRTFSCSEGLLFYICKTSPTHRLVKNENGEMVVEKIDREFETKSNFDV